MGYIHKRSYSFAIFYKSTKMFTKLPLEHADYLSPRKSQGIVCISMLR